MIRFLIILWLGAATVVRGAEYHIYCSSTNTAAGDGTIGNPYSALSLVPGATITARAAAGDQVFVNLQRGSIFRQEWILPAGDFAVQAYDTLSTNNPIIAGDDVMTGWGIDPTLRSRGIVWTNSKAGVAMLFANGDLLSKQDSLDADRLLNHQWFTSNNVVWVRWDEGNPDELGIVLEGSVRATSMYANNRSNVAFHNITFRRASGYGVRVRNSPGFTFEECRFVQGQPLMELDNSPMIKVNRCVFQHCPSSSVPMVRLWNVGSTNWTFRYCLFENSAGSAISGAPGGGNSLVNCTFAKVSGYFVSMPANSYLGITNCVFSGTQAGPGSGTTAGVRSLGTCFMDSSLVMYSARRGSARTAGVTEFNRISGEPCYVSTRHPAWFVFTRDDSTSINYSINDVCLLRNRGLDWPVTLAYTTKVPNPVISLADSNALVWLVNQGAEVMSHARWHGNVMESRAFHVTYLGAASTATLTISNSHLTTTIDGMLDKNLDLTSPAYDTLGKVVAALNSGDYRATNRVNWGIANNTSSRLLANVNEANIAGAAHTNHLQWTDYVDEQVVGSKSDLELVFGQRSPPYAVKSFVLPGSQSDNTWPAVNAGIVNTNLQRAGYTSCRAGGSVPSCSYLASALNPFLLGNMPDSAGEILELSFNNQNTGDSSPKGNSFAGVNVTFSPAAALGTRAAVFNGSNAYLHRPASAAFDCRDGDWSLTVFVCPANLQGRQTVYFNGTNDVNYLWIYLDAMGAAHVEAATDGYDTVKVSTPAGVFTNGGWRWLWVQQAFDEWNIRVDDVLQGTVHSPLRLPYFSPTSTNYLGCRFAFSEGQRTDYFDGMMDEVEMFVNPLSLTLAAADSMGEEGGCGIFYTHATGPGKFMVKVDALQRHTGDIRVVTQQQFVEMCWANGTVSELDGMTLLRTNPLPNKADYRLRASSPCRHAGNPAALVGLTNQYDLLGMPITGGSGELLLSTISAGCYQYVPIPSLIPPAWYQQYGLEPDGAGDFLDLDGDSFNNFEEWIADTNPTNAASLFRIIAIEKGPPVTVSVPTSAQRLYTLYSITDLTSSWPDLTWNAVPGQVDIPGTGGLLTLTNGNDTETRLYRVGVRLP